MVHVINILLINRTFSNQLFAIKITHSRVNFDKIIHCTLSECWLITFVVSVLTEADHVDNNIFTEFLTVTNCEVHGFNTSFSVITIDVQYRNRSHFRYVRRVTSAASFFRTRCETNLVVDDDMDGSTSFVRADACHLQNFLYDTLASKSGFTVDQNWNNLFLSFITAKLHRRARHSQSHCIHSF
ncbi:hypothetical protein D3C87_1643330 [compost metagenome]